MPGAAGRGVSNHDNHRRGERYRTENEPRWESANPGKGANSSGVARARRSWKQLRSRRERRTKREDEEE